MKTSSGTSGPLKRQQSLICPLKTWSQTRGMLCQSLRSKKTRPVFMVTDILRTKTKGSIKMFSCFLIQSLFRFSEISVNAYRCRVFFFFEEITTCAVIVSLLCWYFVPYFLETKHSLPLGEKGCPVCWKGINPFVLTLVGAFICDIHGAAIAKHFNELVLKLCDVEVQTIQERCILHMNEGYNRLF